MFAGALRTAMRLLQRKPMVRKVVTGIVAAGTLLAASRTARMYSDKVMADAERDINKAIADLKKKHGDQAMTFPQVTFSGDGRVYRMEFLVDQRRCDIFSLIVTAASIIQEKEGDSKIPGQPFVTIKPFKRDNTMTFQIVFFETGANQIRYKGTISVLGEFKTDFPGFRFILEKETEISETDKKMFIQVYELANLTTTFSTQRSQSIAAQSRQGKISKKDKSDGLMSTLGGMIGGDKEEQKEEDEVIKKLKEMGVIVFAPDNKGFLEGLSWDVLAGYESQKRDIEDTVLLSLTHSQIFDEITKETRARFEKNRAKAVLFEGPPGTGKTTSAKIIASQVGIPLLYLPLESVMSKWYGESEKKLADIFELANKMGKAIIFIDEVDALAVGRSSVGVIHSGNARGVETNTIDFAKKNRFIRE
jgi:hypothetical protein